MRCGTFVDFRGKKKYANNFLVLEIYKGLDLVIVKKIFRYSPYCNNHPKSHPLSPKNWNIFLLYVVLEYIYFYKELSPVVRTNYTIHRKLTHFRVLRLLLGLPRRKNL